MIDSSEDFKQIDDIIDARKKLGQYDVCKHGGQINYRYAYSSSTSTVDKFIRFDDSTMLINEGDYFNNSDLKPTDSELTIVRSNGLALKRRPSKWDMMHDIAVPGDGSHLGESPSLVNLATLVEHNEYLVPLSSWDPYYKSEETDKCSRASNYLSDDWKVEEAEDGEEARNCCGTPNQFSEKTVSDLDLNVSDLDLKNANRRSSLAGRISKFWRKHCKKTKTLPDNEQGHQSQANNKQ